MPPRMGGDTLTQCRNQLGQIEGHTYIPIDIPRCRGMRRATPYTYTATTNIAQLHTSPTAASSQLHRETPNPGYRELSPINKTEYKLPRLLIDQQCGKGCADNCGCCGNHHDLSSDTALIPLSPQSSLTILQESICGLLNWR